MRKLARAQTIYVLAMFLCVGAFFALIVMAMEEDFGAVFWVGLAVLPVVAMGLVFYCCEKFRCPGCRRIVGAIFRQLGVSYCPRCGRCLAANDQAGEPAPSPAPACEDLAKPSFYERARGAGSDLFRAFAAPIALLLVIVTVLYVLQAFGPYGRFLWATVGGVAAFWASLIICASLSSKRIRCPNCGRSLSDLHGDLDRITHCPFCGGQLPQPRQEHRNEPA